MTKKAIPSYSKPPVVEVVWAAHFPPLEWMTAAHAGVYWQLVQKDFPNCDEQVPMEPKEEPAELLRPPQPIATLLQKPPLCRQWFVSASGNDVIQLQRDWFCVNWRKVRQEDQYPRYERMAESFAARWTQFCDFVKQQGQAPPEVKLLEMTYINNIYKEQGWSDPKEIGEVFPAVSFQEEHFDFLPAPATFASGMVFDINAQAGRLYVSCRHAREIDTNREFFRLELVSRGRLNGGTLDDIMTWFAHAREWIVRGFADLTDREIQVKQWGRER
jgi:uncharacterized protein (TIGR04255 family)